MVKNLPTMQETQVWLIPGSGRFPGEGNGHPLQYSCLENSMERGAWWATVHEVSEESDTSKWLTLALFTCECAPSRWQADPEDRFGTLTLFIFKRWSVLGGRRTFSVSLKPSLPESSALGLQAWPEPKITMPFDFPVRLFGEKVSMRFLWQTVCLMQGRIWAIFKTFF